MPNEVDDSDLLQNCPFCDYSLKGLPTEHRCPECGQPFDRRWRVFGAAPAWRSLPRQQRKRSIIILICIVALPCLFLILLVMGSQTYFPLFQASILVVIFGGVIWQQLRPRDRFVGVGPGGVVVFDRKHGKLKLLPWDRVRDAKIYLFPILRLRDRVMPVQLPAELGPDMKHCVDYINNYERPDELG